MQAHADVEAVLAAGLHHVLVGADTGRFQSCREEEEEEQRKVEENTGSGVCSQLRLRNHLPSSQTLT